MAWIPTRVFVFTLIFLLGIALGGWLGGVGARAVFIAALVLGAVGWLRRPQRWAGRSLWLAIGLVFLALGALRFQAALPAQSSEHIAHYNDDETQWALVGVLTRLPDERDTYANLWLAVEEIRTPGGEETLPVDGRLLAVALPGGGWRYGDRLLVQGRLATPPENELFSYRNYLAQRGIFSLMRNARVSRLESGQGNPFLTPLYTLKAQALALVFGIWPQPEASLLAGILLGVESQIPRAVEDAFNRTGTSHVIAISGFNITIVAGLLVSVFARLWGLRRGALAAALGIAAYTVLVGAEAAVVRAALMGGLSLLARQVGRRQAGLNSLVTVAAVMALFNPLILWDVGFQLSFAATLGLVLYAEPLQEAFRQVAGRWLPAARVEALAGPAGEYLLFTLAAQFTTLPVILYHFQRLSLIALPANFAILPLQPPLLMLGGLSLLAGLVWPAAGQALGWLAWPFAAATIRLVEFFDGWGGSWVIGRLPLWAVWLFFGLLLGATLGWEKLQPRLPRLQPAFWLAGLLVAAALVWQAALRAPDGRLHLTVLDVGNGEALLLQTPEGRYVLLNGGPSATRLGDGLGRRLPLFGGGLDVLVVGSTRAAALGGLPPVLERYPPRQVLWAGLPSASRAAGQVQAALIAAGSPAVPAAPGATLDLGQGARLETLAAGPRGAVFMLAWGDFRALLPLGVDAATIESLVIPPVTVLLLAEEGYAALNPPTWLAATNPQVVLLSVAPGHPEGLPAPEVLAGLQGRTLLRTDQHGWIEIETDGTQMWLKTGR